MLKKVLIANRGEIAVRIVRACRELGIPTVAVYSDADRRSLHVAMADEAYHIGPPPPRESYLDIDKIIDVAKRSGADAVHPGYGFLAENAEFAARCEEEGITFIGPTPEAIRQMGDKITARKIAIKVRAPVVPGTKGAVTDVEAEAEAKAMGFPVMIKASAGGGGKGMRLVRTADEFAAALRMARSEAHSAFGDDSVYIEKYIEKPRHVEIQVLADSHGNVVHLFERECSVQRRHQKVIEEAPSGFVSEKTRQQMGRMAVKIAKAVGYRGAGTCEFIMDQEENFYFLEMNTRIQVEHPVTEMITGIDIVKWMIRVAAGERLPWKQKDITRRGHSLECRIYAEVPEQNFMPSPGTVEYIRSPSGPGIREDSSVFKGGEITPHYDPMISKLIVWAEDRPSAIERMRSALKEYVVLGVKTNIAFLLRVLEEEEFRRCNIDTGYIDRHPELLEHRYSEEDITRALQSAAVALSKATAQIDTSTLQTTSAKWKSFGRRMAVSRNLLL